MSSQEKTISDLAYHLWHARGCPNGSADVDWIEAERQVMGHLPQKPQTPSDQVDGALDATFPASDPVASQIPDQRPVNADDKWKTAKKKSKR